MSLVEFRSVSPKTLMKSESWRFTSARESRSWMRRIAATRSNPRVRELHVDYPTVTSLLASPIVGQRVEQPHVDALTLSPRKEHHDDQR